jgi:hypothetical protein
VTPGGTARPVRETPVGVKERAGEGGRKLERKGGKGRGMVLVSEGGGEKGTQGGEGRGSFEIPDLRGREEPVATNATAGMEGREERRICCRRSVARYVRQRSRVEAGGGKERREAGGPSANVSRKLAREREVCSFASTLHLLDSDTKGGLV